MDARPDLSVPQYGSKQFISASSQLSRYAWLLGINPFCIASFDSNVK